MKRQAQNPFQNTMRPLPSYWGLMKDFFKSDCLLFLRAFILHSYDLWHTGGVKPCTLQFWHGQYLMKAELHSNIWDLGLFWRSNLSLILRLGIHQLWDNFRFNSAEAQDQFWKASPLGSPQVLHIPLLCTHSPYHCTAPCLSLQQASKKHTKPRPGQKIRRK